MEGNTSLRQHFLYKNGKKLTKGLPVITKSRALKIALFLLLQSHHSQIFYHVIFTGAIGRIPGDQRLRGVVEGHQALPLGVLVAANDPIARGRVSVRTRPLVVPRGSMRRGSMCRGSMCRRWRSM
jgi:hypothetical protein